MKNRQKVRNFILILSLFSFPVTQFYFSPYLMVWGASQGIITASFFTFAFLFFGALFLGRAFCGWIMPCAGIQETLFSVNSKPVKAGKSRYLKYAIWFPWLIVIILLVFRAGGYREVEYLFHLEHGISVSNIYMYIPYYAVLLLFIGLSVVFGKRANCYYICWMSPFMVLGRKLSNLLTLPALRLQADQDRCIECNRCSKECPMSLDVCAMVLNGKMENSDCILCGKCADICPKGVISFYLGRPGR